MSRLAPARRLLALLTDERDLESAPIAEVRADLAALGFDPSRVIALSRRLAANTTSPGATLLQRIAAAEAGDDDIRRLEQADIAEVRQRLPEGTTAAIVAQAQRAAGRDSNVVGLRRRRSRRLLIGLSGVAAALAASLVLVVGTSRQHGFAPSLVPESETAATTVAAVPQSNETDNLQARYAPAADAPVGSPARQSADSEAAKGASLETEGPVIPSGGREPDSRLADARNESAPASPAEFRRDENAEQLRGNTALNKIAAHFGLDRPIVALLIVDPNLAPPDLKQQDYPTGQLLARLDDARRVAGDRPIVALVTTRDADRSYDAVVVGRPALSDRFVAEAGLAGESGFQLIELDRR